MYWEVEMGVQRFQDIRLENGILIPGKLNREQGMMNIWPLQHPNLPTEFAKVKDTQSAIYFELDYTPLGYDYLVFNPRERKGGDPLDWVLEQAMWVRFALDMIYAFAQQDSTRLRELLESHTKDAGLETSIVDMTKEAKNIFPDAKRRVFRYPDGAGYANAETLYPNKSGDVLSVIPSLIATLVNANTKGMRQELWEKEFVWVRKFRTLIEVIWSMVGELAVRSTAEADYFRRCEWCGTPFLANDKRQRFCPDEFSKQSLCGLKYRQYKLEVRQKPSTLVDKINKKLNEKE
jgi:hypothetical protein